MYFTVTTVTKHVYTKLWYVTFSILFVFKILVILVWECNFLYPACSRGYKSDVWAQEFRHVNPSRAKNFLFSMSRPVLGPTQLSVQWVLQALSSGVKQPHCEADHSPPTSAKVK
jgi:hypothetical protein